MPETLFRRPKGRKWWLLWVPFIAMVSFWLIRHAAVATWVWVLIGMTWLLLALGLLPLLPRSSFLKLGRDGLQVGKLWRTQTIPWEHISGFGVAAAQQRRSAGKMHFVGFNFTDASKELYSYRVLQESRKVFGFDATLPDSYGLAVEELARHLSQLHRVYTEEDSSDAGVEPQGL